ncbi:MAG TPA: ATP-binding protein [Steroidobacteraceae bacterium]|nr:ATP-binding protein [Steroidobacteraceae bacterium]
MISGNDTTLENASRLDQPSRRHEPAARACAAYLPAFVCTTLALWLATHAAVAYADTDGVHNSVFYSIFALLLIQTGLIVALLVRDRQGRRAKLDMLRLQSEMTHAARLAMAGEITASIAHEVTQPLSATLNNVETVELLLGAPQENATVIGDILVDIKRDNLRAHEIVRRLRTLLRKRELKFERIEINELIANVVMLVRADATRRGVSVGTTLEADLPLLEADPVHLEQVLLNLVLNAMDAMKDPQPTARSLAIHSRSLGSNAVEIAVLDSGHGMTDEQLARAFESFFTTKEAGMGLGLSIARSIAKSHGGSISAERRREGGMIFRVSLPLRTPRPSELRQAI